MSDSNDENTIQVHIAQDLDYVYRDVANIYVGAGEVTLEFGNHHRSMPGHVTIANRIVLSVAGAYDFQRRLQQSLQEAQQRLRDELKRDAKE